MSSKVVEIIAIVLSILCVIGSFIVGNAIADILRESEVKWVLISIIAGGIGVLPLYIFSSILENQEDISSNLYSLRVDFDKYKKDNK